MIIINNRIHNGDKHSVPYSHRLPEFPDQFVFSQHVEKRHLVDFDDVFFEKNMMKELFIPMARKGLIGLPSNFRILQ